MSGSWQAERGSRRTRRHPRDDPRAEVAEDVRVGPVEFQLNSAGVCCLVRNVMSSQDVVDFVKQRLESGVTQLSAVCEEVRQDVTLLQPA